MAIELPPPPRPSMHGLPPAPAFVVLPEPPPIEIFDLESEPELDLNGYKALCQRNSRRGLERLMKIINDDEQPASSHISAIRELNDRSFGKSKQTVEITEPDEFATWTVVEIEHYAVTGERPKQ